MSICIAIIPTAQAIAAIEAATSQYGPYIKEKVPENRWHIPLVAISATPSLEPLRQSFHQTLRILSLGEGEEKGELWVRIQETPGLSSLRESFRERMQTSGILIEDNTPFVPHIYVGSFEKIPAFGIIDTPLGITFSIREAHILQTDPYETLGSIPLTP